MILDSHAHLTHRQFTQSFRYLRVDGREYTVTSGSLPDVIEACREQGVVGSIEPAISFASNGEIRAFCPPEGYGFYRAVGVHPTRVHLTKWGERKGLVDFITADTVAIGETGLDYHYPRGEQHRLLQKLWFHFQICLADRYRLPLILHVRLADEEALRILKRYRGRLHGGVAHCFSGGPELARRYLSLGFALGIGGTLLQGNEAAQRLGESVKMAPLDSLLVETDAPYILPAFPYDGSKKGRRRIRNTPAILPLVIEEIARIKGMDRERVEEAIYQNTIRIFSLPGRGPATPS